MISMTIDSVAITASRFCLAYTAKCISACAEFTAKTAASGKAPLPLTSYPLLDDSPVGSVSTVNIPRSLSSDEDGK